MKIVTTALALAFATAGFGQSADTTGTTRTTTKTRTHMHKNRTGMDSTHSGYNRSGSMSNGMMDSTGRTRRSSMKMKDKSMMKKNMPDSTQ